MPIRVTLITLLLLSGATAAHAQADQQARGRQAVQGMAGCYLVDYSYVEVQELKPGYVRDPRVYDVTATSRRRSGSSRRPCRRTGCAFSASCS